MGSINYFRILKDLINLFLSLVCINYAPNQNGKVLEETPADFNLDAVKATLRHLPLPPPKFFKNFFPFLCHFATFNREYNEWLFRSRCHIKFSRLLFQGTWLGLMAQCPKFNPAISK